MGDSLARGCTLGDQPVVSGAGPAAYSEVVRVDVLGPLRVTDSSGADITPDGLLQRRLLALLVLRRGQVVSVDTAVDVLWPAARPRDPVAALQNHVSRLRRALPAGGTIARTGVANRSMSGRASLVRGLRI